METYEHVVDVLCGGETPSDNIEVGLRLAIALGFEVTRVGDLKPGDTVGYVTLDPFGFGPEPEAQVEMARVRELRPGKWGDVDVVHSDGVTSAYETEFCLARKS